MPKVETIVRNPIEYISTSSWGMNGMEIIKHRNIAYLNNAIFELIEKVDELENKIKELENEKM